MAERSVADIDLRAITAPPTSLLRSPGRTKSSTSSCSIGSPTARRPTTSATTARWSEAERRHRFRPAMPATRRASAWVAGGPTLLRRHAAGAREQDRLSRAPRRLRHLDQSGLQAARLARDLSRLRHPGFPRHRSALRHARRSARARRRPPTRTASASSSTSS